MHVTEQKNELRNSIKRRLKLMDVEEREAESRSVSRRLIELIPAGSVVCAYWPMRTEVNLQLFMQELIDRGDDFYLPCFEDGSMIYRKFTDPDDLRKGEMNTMDPPPNAEQLDTKTADYILVPGLAFDTTGARLGRGNGGFDKWLEKKKERGLNAQLIGIAHECQLVEEVPTEPHDIAMDVIVSPRMSLSV